MKASTKRVYDYLHSRSIDLRVWTLHQNMMARCYNPNNPFFKDYGGRGITVCKRWRDYATFAADIGEHPGNGLTFDRKNNNGNYRRGNWRWATRSQQQRNKRTTRLSWSIVKKIRSYVNRGIATQTEMARRYRVTPGCICKVVHGDLWS